MNDITDFYLLGESLNDTQRDIQLRVRKFAREDVLPVINDYWERADFPFELLPKLAKLGVVGTFIEGYGCPGMDRLAAAMVALEMSRGDGSINTFLGVQSGLAMGSIALLGDEDQKQRWLPAMAKLEKIGSFALTEPEHGSDSVALETTRPPRRRPLGAQRHQALDRQRQLSPTSSCSGPATRPTARSRHSSSKATPTAATRRATTPRSSPARSASARSCSRTSPSTNVRVPAENKLAEASSFKDVSRVLTHTRGGASWESLGHAIAAYECAVDYAKGRIQFGKPIASFQLVQNKLANMLAELTAMQLICFRMAPTAGTGQAAPGRWPRWPRCTPRKRHAGSAPRHATSSAATACCWNTTSPAT